MEAFISNIMRWPFVEDYFRAFAWAWPLNEVMHFVGLILLVGIVGMYDLRLLGLAKKVPVGALRQLLPWAFFGLVLVLFSGILFTTGIYTNVGVPPYVVLTHDVYLQMKFVFLGLAGLNLLAFYVTGMARATDNLGPGEDAPPLAKTIAGASLFCWVAVMYFGRLIPWGQFS
jgi:hypothetical protein